MLDKIRRIFNYSHHIDARPAKIGDVNKVIEGVSKFKVYRALISQVSLGNPTTIVLENSLGNIVWTRQSAGNYEGTLVGAFPLNKVFTRIVPPYSGTSSIAIRSDDNKILIMTSEAGNSSDSRLLNSPIEILVYN
jgi:hypothetical protein